MLVVVVDHLTQVNLVEVVEAVVLMVDHKVVVQQGVDLPTFQILVLIVGMLVVMDQVVEEDMIALLLMVVPEVMVL